MSGPLRLFLGHHKCATGWTNAVLRDTTRRLGWGFDIVNRPVDWAPFGSLAAMVKARGPDVLSFNNVDATHLHGLPEWRGFHVVRDPRDVLVSGYFSHKHSHPTAGWPELEAHREALQSLSPTEGLLLEMEFSRPFLGLMERWDYGHSEVLEIRFEELTRRPFETFARIYGHLSMLREEEPGRTSRSFRSLVMSMNRLNARGRGLPPFHLPLCPIRYRLEDISADSLRAILERRRFEKMSGGRTRGKESVRSHYRKGVSGDWRNHFETVHIRRFKEEYGDLLIQLGYEENTAW
jgi:hypothetical protein